MSNIIALENISVPAFLQARVVDNASFMSGLPMGGGYPSVKLNGTRFEISKDGSTTTLPTLEIAVVLIAAKPNLNKAYYAQSWVKGQEPKSPDCFSDDGIKPDASATMKQCDSCAGCPMNQFGSGKDQNGNPGKGKACSDNKIVSLYANDGVYGFKIPPASLKPFANYVKETSRRGVDLSTAITVVGFDPAFSFPVLTFNFGGFLGEEQVNKISRLKQSQEVADIIGGTPTLVAPSVASAPVQVAIAAPVSDPFASVEAAPAKPKVVKAAAKPIEKPVVVEDDDLAALASELGIDL